MPDWVDWYFMRPVASDGFTASLVEVETQWSLEDLQAAHAVLDAQASHAYLSSLKVNR